MEDEASTSLDGKFLGNLRVVDLKQELEKRGLSKSGSKKDLVKRLKQQLEFEKLCEERKSSGDLIRKLELDAEIQQNEFVQQYLAQQQKRYAEREEKRLEMEAMQKQEKETSVISKESQKKSEQIASPDSDEMNNENEEDPVRNKPSNNDPQNENIENPKLHTADSVEKNESNSSASETDNEQSCPSTTISEGISVDKGNLKNQNQGKTEIDQSISQSFIDVIDSKNESQITLSSLVPQEELTKNEEKNSSISEHVTKNTELTNLASIHYISKDDTKAQSSSESDLDKCPNKIKNLDVSVHISKDENDNKTLSLDYISKDDTKAQSSSESDLDKCPNEIKNLDASVHISKDENDNKTLSLDYISKDDTKAQSSSESDLDKCPNKIKNLDASIHISKDENDNKTLSLDYISKDDTKAQSSSESDLDKCPNKIKNLDASIHISKDENDNKTSSHPFFTYIKIHTHDIEPESEASSTPKEKERITDSSHAPLEVASSSQS